MLGADMVGVWLNDYNDGLNALYVLHKLAALVYYQVTYRSCVEFMSPIYTDKAAWVIIAQERFNLHPISLSI
jgi:hypothetical protein